MGSSVPAAITPFAGPVPRSFVAGERLGFGPPAVVAILEDVGYPNRGRDPLDPALHELEVGPLAKAQPVQARSLSPTDVTRRRIALWVDVGVVPDEGLPVLITSPFD